MKFMIIFLSVVAFVTAVPVERRGLLDTITSITNGTKIGTAMKILNAFNQVGEFMNDLKKLDPNTHQKLQGEIDGIKSGMSGIISDIAGMMEHQSATTPPGKRGLLDTLTQMTSGTKIGTAMKVMDTFNQIGQFLNDLKTLAPDAHKALEGSINNLKSSMTDIVSDLSGNKSAAPSTVAPATKSVRSLLDTLTELTGGTKIGTAMKVVDTFNKIGQFLNDLKTMAPDAHAALQGSIDNLKNSMTDIIGDFSGSKTTAKTATTTTTASPKRGLLDTMTQLTDGTKVGTALKILNAFNQVGEFMNDLKNLDPKTHQKLQGEIDGIKSGMSGIITDIAGMMEGGKATTKSP